jgi:NAD(P)-dependent dehydrogenase (short-subunit alcohol dehydrogenase family)
VLAVAEGARVVIADPDGDTIGAMIGALGHNYADGIVCDFGDEAQFADMAGLAVRRFGRLDAAFNVQIVGANIMGMALCIKHEAARLVAQSRGGSITNLFDGPVAGVAALTTAAAVEFRPNSVRVNAVGPVGVRSSAAQAAAAARIAIYLASDDALAISRELLAPGDVTATARYPDLARYLAQPQE